MSPRPLLISALATVAFAQGATSHNANSGAGGLAEVFSTPQPYATPLRLERTPRMDGVFRPEEWDLLWSEGMPRVSSDGLAPAPLKGTIGTTTSTPPTGVTLLQTPTTTADLAGAKPLAQDSIGPAHLSTKQDKAGNKPLVPTNIEPVAPQTPLVVPVAESAYMSWEPGKLYFGAILAQGKDMLISIDAGNNGFLVGADNVEFRVTPGSPPTVKARIMDATAATGPVWIDAPGFIKAGTVVSTPRPDGSTFVEFEVVDPGYNVLHPELKNEFGLRIDSIPSTAPQAEAFLPRLMSKVKLTDQRVTNLPAGIDVTVGNKGRSVLPGEATSVRWQLTGSDTLGIKSMEIGGEGDLSDQVNFLRVPQPTFDPRGQTSIDYPTRVVPKTPIGYGVLRGELSGKNWNGAFVESSFRIAPVIDINAPAKQAVGGAKALSLTCKADIVSNTEERIDGNFQVLPPDGWRVTDGTNKSFFIPSKGATAKREFVLAAPAGTRGTFKATLRIVVLGDVIDQPYWITVQ